LVMSALSGGQPATGYSDAMPVTTESLLQPHRIHLQK